MAPGGMGVAPATANGSLLSQVAPSSLSFGGAPSDTTPASPAGRKSPTRKVSRASAAEERAVVDALIASLPPVAGASQRTSRGTWAAQPVVFQHFTTDLRASVWRAVAADYMELGIVAGSPEDLVSSKRPRAAATAAKHSKNAKVASKVRRAKERPTGPMGDLTGLPLALAIADLTATPALSPARRKSASAQVAEVTPVGRPAARRVVAARRKDDFFLPDEVRPGRDGIAQYLDDIGRYRRLTRAEENALSMRSLDADNSEEDRKEAQDALVNHNLRLAVTIAKDFTRGAIPLVDLISQANEGLIIASQKFDWRLGTPFGNYASYWCKQRCLKFVAEQGFSVRVPPHRAALVNQVVRTNARLMQAYGRRPSAAEVVEELNRHIALAAEETSGLARGRRKPRKPVTLVEVEKVMETLQAPLELDAPLSTEGDAATMGSWFGETAQDADSRLDDQLDQIDRARAVEAAVAELPDREAQVVRWYFGLGSPRALDLEQIASRLGVTRERARQIKHQAFLRLKDSPALQLLLEA